MAELLRQIILQWKNSGWPSHIPKRQFTPARSMFSFKVLPAPAPTQIHPARLLPDLFNRIGPQPTSSCKHAGESRKTAKRQFIEI